MITNFAKAHDEEIRAMFRALFHEETDLAVRIDAFQNAAEELRVKYDDVTGRNPVSYTHLDVYKRQT